MRIQAIDNEQEWERRVRKLEADVVRRCPPPPDRT